MLLENETIVLKNYILDDEIMVPISIYKFLFHEYQFQVYTYSNQPLLIK